MMKFRAIHGRKTLDGIMQLVLGGQLQLLYEHSQYVNRIFVLSPRGETVAYIHPSCHSEMMDFFNEHAREDGLFPGFSQTAAVGKPLEPRAPDGFLVD